MILESVSQFMGHDRLLAVQFEQEGEGQVELPLPGLDDGCARMLSAVAHAFAFVLPIGAAPPRLFGLRRHLPVYFRVPCQASKKNASPVSNFCSALANAFNWRSPNW